MVHRMAHVHKLSSPWEIWGTVERSRSSNPKVQVQQTSGYRRQNCNILQVVDSNLQRTKGRRRQLFCRHFSAVPYSWLPFILKTYSIRISMFFFAYTCIFWNSYAMCVVIPLPSRRIFSLIVFNAHSEYVLAV